MYSKVLGKDSLKILTQQTNKHVKLESGPRISLKLKKKPKATKCSDRCTISLIAHTAKIVARILQRRRHGRKIVDAENNISTNSGKRRNSLLSSQTGRRHMTV
jgi:hypothetical protein